MQKFRSIKLALSAFTLCGIASVTAQAQRLPLASGVEKVCSIPFNKDEKRPARVEDGALPCLTQAAQKLKETPNVKLVLVCISHPVFDHEEKDRGMEREVEDMTGADVRYEDVAAYRAVNVKTYLTQFFQLDAKKIIPTTDEYQLGREVIVYTVPANANFVHNYTATTPINEKVCTIEPCYPPKDDVLTPQPRPRIQTASNTTTTQRR